MVTIGLARVRNGGPGDAARLRRACAQATPGATGVPEKALLVIANLRSDRPLARTGEAFAAALIASIRARKRSARRGGAISDTDDVYFEDDDALETALVTSTLAGDRLPAVLVAAIPDLAQPLTRWRRHVLRDPRRLPMIVTALIRNGTAAPWLARFDDHEISRAADLILRHAGVDDTVATFAARWNIAEADQPADPPHPHFVPDAVRRAVAAAENTGARAPIRILLAVAMLAAERPDMLATRAFARALETLRADTPALQSDRAVPQPAGTATDRAARPAVSAANLRGSDAPNRKTPRPGHVGAGPAPSTADHFPSSPAHQPVAGPPLPRRRSDAGNTTPCSDPLAPTMASTESDFAGLFFLLTSFATLGLYGDFSSPRTRIAGLSPFELMLLVGQRWFGTAFERDPLPALLRALAGIAPSAPVGRDFEASVWQIPDDWLAPWPQGEARTIGRSRWHRAGFPISDDPGIPRSRAARRRRWVDCFARYLEARLARALGETDRRRAFATVGQRRGRVMVVGDHLSIAFSLDDHPIELRLAGLDRDIGWFPAAGRSIGFVFT